MTNSFTSSWPGDLLLTQVTKTRIRTLDRNRLSRSARQDAGRRRPDEMEMDIVDEQVDKNGRRAFMGLTVDAPGATIMPDPIPTSDYYSRAGMF